MRILLRALVITVVSVALNTPIAGGASAHPHHPRPSDRIEMPFEPEALTIGPEGVAYVGAADTGAIYAVNLRTRQGREVTWGGVPTACDPPCGFPPPSVGMKLDRWGRLWVARAYSGLGTVYDARTGERLAAYELGCCWTYLNDVVLGRTAAYFTESYHARIFVVPLPSDGRLAAESEVRSIELRGEWRQVRNGLNATGIALTPDRRALLVMQSATGLLFRVHPRTGVATQVDLGSTVLPSGDGILVRGRTLYVVQGHLNRIAVIRLNRRGTSGSLRRFITSPHLDYPTTVAAYDEHLYLPSARSSIQSDHWLTRTPR